MRDICQANFSVKQGSVDQHRRCWGGKVKTEKMGVGIFVIDKRSNTHLRLYIAGWAFREMRGKTGGRVAKSLCANVLQPYDITERIHSGI